MEWREPWWVQDQGVVEHSPLPRWREKVDSGARLGQAALAPEHGRLGWKARGGHAISRKVTGGSCRVSV